MNLLLINCFKNFCDERLKELIDRCYISVKELDFPINQEQEPILVCGIYCPPALSNELFNYQKELEAIGHKLQINRIYVLEVQPVDLNYFREEAKINNDTESWRTYLEMQYIF